jgi:ribulose-phosphate 3-epimerase
MGKEKILIAPSILSADFSKLGEDIKAIEAAGADWVHIDVMDGNFVPNITIGPVVIRSIRKCTDLLFDVHLMIDDPGRYVEEFADAGSDFITFHLEACSSPNETIGKIRDKGKKVGISIKPGTEVATVMPFLDKVDMVLIMTVEPGFAGQSFTAAMLDKVVQLKKEYKGLIQIDGGINKDTAKEAISAGANVLVAGTAVFGTDNYSESIAGLKG